MKRNLILILILSATFFSFSQTRKVDSVLSIFYDKKQIDTNRLNAINDIAWYYKNSNPDTAISLAEQEIKLAKSLSNHKGNNWIARALCIEGISYMNKGSYSKAMEYYLQSQKLCEENGNKKTLGICYINMGNLFVNQSNYPKALEHQLKALKIYEELKNKQGMGACYNNIGKVYRNQSNYEKALEYYLKDLKICQEIDEKGDIGTCYNNIGDVYYHQSKFPTALKYFFKALDCRKKIGNKKGMGDCYNNIGEVYLTQLKYSRAFEFYLKALQLYKEIPDKYSIEVCYGNIGGLYNKLANYKLGILYNDSSLQICKEIGDIDGERLAYENLAEAYSKTDRYREAYENQVKFKQLTDSIFNGENSKELSDLKTDFEVKKKEVELKAKAEAKEAISVEEKKRQKLVIYSVVSLLILVMVFAVFIFNRFKITQKQKNIIEKQKGIVEEQKIIVEQQKDEVEQQKLLIEEKQKEIVDSITYAKRLQQAILPSKEEIKKHLPNSFIFYKPKDIVAGDFYWMEYLNEIIYIAVADSTGHGVPGAMVSVVCSNALNRAVKEFGLRETGKILDKTRELVLDTFAKSGEEIKDGMDISLLSISRKKKQIEWSGANNQLWYISNNELIEIQPDKQPIGKADTSIPFTTHVIKLKQGDKFYLMTDGYPDQFGGVKGKKLKYKQLEELLLKNNEMELEEEKNILEEFFNKWKGNLEQVDDVTIMGIKI